MLTQNGITCRSQLLRSQGSKRQVHVSAQSTPGPEGAFIPGQEGQARQKLFNRIAPVYDEVSGHSLAAHVSLVTFSPLCFERVFIYKPGTCTQGLEPRVKLVALSLRLIRQLNDKLSFGQHWVWKRMTVAWSGAKPGGKVLDVCCGSGDIAFLLARIVGAKGQVTGLDFAAEMLDDAAKRQKRRQAEGEALAPIE